jgi:hypothetical protein
VVTSAAEDAIVRAEAKGGNRVEFVLPDGQPSKSRPPGRLSMPSPRVLRSQPS